MKLAKTIRFDPSDLNIFPLAADEGEWALVGTFCFAAIGESDIKVKVKIIDSLISRNFRFLNPRNVRD